MSRLRSAATAYHYPVGWQTSAKQLVMMFLNKMHSVHYYFIHTTVIYKFTALLKFTYITHADLLKYFAVSTITVKFIL